jgi:hypothetical protein
MLTSLLPVYFAWFWTGATVPSTPVKPAPACAAAGAAGREAAHLADRRSHPGRAARADRR